MVCFYFNELIPGVVNEGVFLAASRAFRNRPRDPGEMLGVHICLLWKPQTPANRWPSAPGSPLCLLCFFLHLDGACKIWDLIGNNIVPGKAHNLPSKGALHRLKMSVLSDLVWYLAESLCGKILGGVRQAQIHLKESGAERLHNTICIEMGWDLTPQRAGCYLDSPWHWWQKASASLCRNSVCRDDPDMVGFFWALVRVLWALCLLLLPT